MAHKIIFVPPNGKVPKRFDLSSGDTVTWKPFPAKGYEVGIRFVKSVPFSDWGTSVEMRGPSVSGTVKIHVGKRGYGYKASYRAAQTLSPSANPELIVDGGGGPDPKRPPRKRPRTRTRTPKE